MTVKKEYSVGDTVWIYGIGNNVKPTQGTVVKSFTIDYQGYNDEVHYVIAIPTHIEDLLEIRTWHTISQDSKGPIGSFRDLGSLSATHKLASRTGYLFEGNALEEGPSAEEIMSALEKSIDDHSHQPLILKEVKAKPRRRFVRKKSKE